MRSLLTAVAFLVLGCGPAASRPVDLVDPDSVVPVPSPTVQSKVLVKIFSAQWCMPCKRLAAEFGKELRDLKKETRARMQIELYVVSGARSTDVPTQKDADFYKAKYFPECDLALPDQKMANYRKYKAGDGSIPSVVLVNEKDQVLYRPAADAISVMNAILDELK